MYKNKMTNSYMTDSEYLEMMRSDARIEWTCMDDEDKADFENFEEFELIFVERFPDTDWEGFDPDSTTFADFISGCVVPDDYAWAGNFDGITNITWIEEKDSEEGPIRFGYGIAKVDITDDDTFRILEEDVDAGTAIVNWEDVPVLITDWQDSFDDVYCIVEVENEPTCRAIPCRRDQNFYMTKEEALAAMRELLPKTSTGLRIFDTCSVNGDMLPDDLKCIRVTDWADYDPAKCRNGGKYRFTTTFYPVENGFEVDFSSSADFVFCGVLGRFQQCGRCQWFDGEDCTIDYEVWTQQEVRSYIEKYKHDENFDIEYIRKGEAE